MERKRIIVTIKPDGSAVSETKGYFGPECTEAADLIEQALGDVLETSPTEEMYQEEHGVEKVSQR